MKAPSECTSMAELRRTIDTIDRRLIELFKLRQDCIDRAIELKPGEDLPARIEARVSQVVANVRASALAKGVDPDFFADMWQELIEWSIAREERVLGVEQAEAPGAEVAKTRTRRSTSSKAPSKDANATTASAATTPATKPRTKRRSTPNSAPPSE